MGGVVVFAAMKVALALLLAACGGVTAEAPLTIPLGTPRAQAVSQLRTHQFCRKDDPPEAVETYPRCDRPGTEWGESWVTARFDESDRLVELRRYERFSDENRAVQRWNDLVAARAKLNPESPDAIGALREKGLLEPGTKTMKAFRVDGDTIVGVYLLTPQPPEEANILEAVVHASK